MNAPQASPTPPKPPENIWDAIARAFPANTEHQRSVSITLRRVASTGRAVELQLADVAKFLRETIDDPPWSVDYGPTTIAELASFLRRLAQRLEQAYFALEDAKAEDWTTYRQPEDPDVSVRPGPLGSSPQPRETIEPPF